MPVCLSACLPYVCNNCRDQRRVSELLELEFKQLLVIL